MEARDFCYWLQGYFEVSGSKELTEEQTRVVQDHLKLVFDKQTPFYTISGYQYPMQSVAGSSGSISTPIASSTFVC